MADPLRLPSGFCPIISAYSGSGPGGVSRSEVEGGYPRYSLIWDGGVMQIALTLRLAQDELFVWAHFFRLIKKGAEQFICPIDTGLGMNDHLVNIVPDSYSTTRNGLFTDVSFTVDVEPEVYKSTEEQSMDIVQAWEVIQQYPMMLRALKRLEISANYDVQALNE
ncbi:hypothetical protein [Advenella mimigardefordensis]|uniref:Uncharacterized protein n=1 Tax=Advenella mimigardefordensis (strain DSM 17166 / LMG 22922 / DPN7) TaxID=1247726 RepID=W0PCS3_ADVMD|nr:hypothetical protein [Advenella mimigardefordensis]AHG63195.1 hypothetical protein MIM_c10970 [Advenella mimigardefordensis DPN7]